MQSKLNYLVTGGAGFIGSHTVDELSKLEKVNKIFVIDDLSNGSLNNLKIHKKNKKVEIIKKDINLLTENNKIFKEIDNIIHYAGSGSIVPSIENPKKYFKDNLSGTINILECARKNKVKNFVYAASSSCYGLANTPTSENHKISCESPYAMSKYMGELASLHFGKIYNLRVNSIRIFNAFGERINTKGVYGSVFPVFFKQFLEKKPLTLVGDGKQKRDYVYVTDVAKAFIKLSLSKSINQEIFNLGSGKPISINYLISKLCGKNYKIIKLPKRPAEPNITYANIKKIKSLVKWKPMISFEEGLENMKKNIEYWRESKLWTKKIIKKHTETWFNYLGK